MSDLIWDFIKGFLILHFLLATVNNEMGLRHKVAISLVTFLSLLILFNR